MKKSILILSVLALSISCADSSKKDSKTEVENFEATEKLLKNQF